MIDVYIVWDPDLEQWQFHLSDSTGFYKAVGHNSSLLYFDDPDDILFGEAKTWLKAIAPDSLGYYKIQLMRPDEPSGGWSAVRFLTLRPK